MTSTSIADPPAADDGASTDLPPLFRRHIRRPRLTRQLDASKARILMLTAPAGYGKTTLAAEWLQPRPPEDVAWYQATTASADVAALSAGIAEAASHILPAGERLRQRLSVPQPPKDPAKTYAELLSADFAKWPKTAWLVIDDYHYLAPSAACEQFVEELVKRCPVRLLITTRTRPSWVTARGIVYGEVTELDESALRMTDGECSDVLRASDIEPQESFVRATDGWPALIGIASLLQDVPHDGAGKVGRALLDYLEEEVLRGVSEDARDFLIGLAQLPTADEAVVAKCFTSKEASGHFATLVDVGLIANREGTQRLHPLFRDVLLASRQAKEYDADVVSRAIDYYEAAEDWHNALALAKQLDLDRRVAQIVSAAAPRLLQEGRLETLEAWIGEAGRWAFVDSSLVTARAELLLRRGRPFEARLLMEELLDPNSGEQGDSAAWRILGQAFHLLSEYPKGITCYERAASLAESKDQEKAAVWGLIICSAPLNSSEVRKYYSRFESLVSEDPNDLLRLTAGRVAIADMEGSFEGLWEHLQTRMPLLGMGTDPIAISAVYRCLCYVSLSRGDFATSKTFANRLIDYCEEVGLTFPVTYVLAYRAMAEIGLRESPPRSGLSANFKKQLASLATHI